MSFLEDDSEICSINNTCTVIRATPWDEFEDGNNWSCPFCRIPLNSEENYFSHIEVTHALRKCVNCSEMYNPEKNHLYCCKYL